MARLDGKVAVITGGSSGIDLAAAKTFVDEGAYVFITGRLTALVTLVMIADAPVDLFHPSLVQAEMAAIGFPEAKCIWSAQSSWSAPRSTPSHERPCSARSS